LNDWFLNGRGSGCNLSSGWLDSNDFWTHVLVLQNELALLALIDAINAETLLNDEKDSSPDGTNNDNVVPETLALHLSCLFRNMWEGVEPLLVWIGLLASSVRFVR